MNNRQISGDVVAQKRQALLDMVNGNVTSASAAFAKTGVQTNEQIDRKLGRIKSNNEQTVSRQDLEKEIGPEVFDISSRIEQKNAQQQQYQHQHQQQYQQQYQQQPYQQPQQQQPYQQPMQENYNSQMSTPVSSDLIQNMLDGRNQRSQQQQPYQQYYQQPMQEQQQYASHPGTLNEETKRELANDIVERIKTSYLREEIMSVLMEDVFSTDRMNKILTENFERLLKGYLGKQARAKAAMKK